MLSHITGVFPVPVCETEVGWLGYRRSLLSLYWISLEELPVLPFWRHSLYSPCPCLLLFGQIALITSSAFCSKNTWVFLAHANIHWVAANDFWMVMSKANILSLTQSRHSRQKCLPSTVGWVCELYFLQCASGNTVFSGLEIGFLFYTNNGS